MRNKKAVVFLTLFGICTSLFAQQSRSYSLNQAIDYALFNNVNVKNAQLNIAGTQKRALEVMTEGFPQLNAKVDYVNNFKLPVSLIPGEFIGQPGQTFETTFGKPHNMTASFDANQLIFDGRYFIGLQARKELMRMSEYQLSQTEIEVKKQITNAYYQALVAQKSYELIQENKQHVERMLYETRELYKAGFAQEIDISRLSLNLSNLNTQISSLQNMAVNALANLKFLMGADQNDQLILTEDINALIEQATPSQVNNTFNPANRIEYTMLSSQIKLNNYDTKQRRAGYYPSMRAFFNYGFNAQRDKFNFWNNDKWYQSGLWGLSLQIPLFDGLKKYSSVQQAKIAEQQVKNNLENFEQASRLEVIVAMNDYSNALKNYQTLKENIELAKSIQSKTNTMYKEGLSSSFELTQAETDLVNTQISLLQAAYNLLQAKTQLDMALGNIK